MVTPYFALTVNNIDVTLSIRDILIRLEYVDYANLKSDELNLTVEGAWNIPKEDDVMELWIGYEETGVWLAGTFVVQSLPFGKDSTTVRATSTNFSKTLKEKTTKTYKSTTLSKIVSKVAKRNALDFRCDIEEDVLYMAQKDESDLHFLTRLATEHDAVFKIKKDLLIFIKKEETTVVHVDLNECSSFSGEPKKREKYKSCTVSYHDSKENKKIVITAGEGEPVLKMEEHFSSESEALIRAKKALKNSERKEFKGSFNIYGQDINAGAKLTLFGDSRLEDREFSITKVTHSLGDGYVIWVEFEG